MCIRDRLGTVTLAYNATMHTTTGYSPHELFYSFPPSCPLDAVVSTPASNPATNADKFALQSFERLQEATAFVCQYSGRNIERMKKRYDSSVKPQSNKIGKKVLVYNPKKRRGKFVKWEVRWVGPYTVQNKLNSANYVVKKGRSKPIVIHIDRLRKLPVEMECDSAASPANDGALARPPTVTRQSDTAAPAADPGSIESVESRPVMRSSSCRNQLSNVQPSLPGLGVCAHIPLSDQHTVTPGTTPPQSAASANKPPPRAQ